VTQSFQPPAEHRIIKEETGHIFQNPQPLSEAIHIGINQTQH
jgi:hypothetical protein